MGREPANSKPDTGRMGFRNPEVDPYPDERPTIYWPHPFWKDEDERERYERAVRSCPVSQYGHLTLADYLAAVVEVAEGIKAQPLVKAMGDER